jgi:hypothetical protein
MDKCTRCKTKEAMHWSSFKGKEENLCCDCHIADGGAPATWHEGCRKYMTLREKQREKMLLIRVSQNGQA